MWSALAAVVAVVHVLYFVFQSLGALLALRSRAWLVPHAAAVGWGVLIVVLQASCPLTLLEKDLIARSGREPYAGSFLDHYVFGTLLPDGSQVLVYALYMLGIVGVTAWVAVQLTTTGRRGAAGPPVSSPAPTSVEA